MNAELNFLSHSSAQFAAFINANSMMNYNDAYKQFIDKAIEEEVELLLSWYILSDMQIEL